MTDTEKYKANGCNFYSDVAWKTINSFDRKIILFCFFILVSKFDIKSEIKWLKKQKTILQFLSIAFLL